MSEALSELIRRGTRNNETARHTIVLRLTGDDLCLLATILRGEAAVSPKSAACQRTASEDAAPIVATRVTRPAAPVGRNPDASTNELATDIASVGGEA